MTEILRAVMWEQDIEEIFDSTRLSKGTIARIEEVLRWYPLMKIEGYNLAYAYREFITGRFIGTMPSWAEKRRSGFILNPHCPDFYGASAPGKTTLSQTSGGIILSRIN